MRQCKVSNAAKAACSCSFTAGVVTLGAFVATTVPSLFSSRPRYRDIPKQQPALQTGLPAPNVRPRPHISNLAPLRAPYNSSHRRLGDTKPAIDLALLSPASPYNGARCATVRPGPQTWVLRTRRTRSGMAYHPGAPLDIHVAGSAPSSSYSVHNQFLDRRSFSRLVPAAILSLLLPEPPPLSLLPPSGPSAPLSGAHGADTYGAGTCSSLPARRRVGTCDGPRAVAITFSVKGEWKGRGREKQGQLCSTAFQRQSLGRGA